MPNRSNCILLALQPHLGARHKAEEAPWVARLEPHRQQLLLALQRLASGYAARCGCVLARKAFSPEALLAAGLIVEEVMAAGRGGGGGAAAAGGGTGATGAEAAGRRGGIAEPAADP
jgi:hypothetical protein